MTKSFFAFCLAAGVSFVIFTNAAIADDTSKDAKPATATATVTADVAANDVDHASPCERRHVRRLPKLRIPRFEFPEIKFPRLNCRLANKVDDETVAEAESVEIESGKVVFERSVSHAGHVKNVKYIKIPGRFLLKRVVTTGEDVEP
ncbi:MAG: hypothetical protein LBB88_11215 [Planctomycetaceae bacterium]|jgi:hypothetical protein|nr:hypothetical protein [Planctomycetaceae bacterium]